MIHLKGGVSQRYYILGLKQPYLRHYFVCADLSAQRRHSTFPKRLDMLSQGTRLETSPEYGTSEGEFFHREENRFRDLDDEHLPTIIEAEEELETNVHTSNSFALIVECAIEGIETGRFVADL